MMPRGLKPLGMIGIKNLSARVNSCPLQICPRVLPKSVPYPSPVCSGGHAMLPRMLLRRSVGSLLLFLSWTASLLNARVVRLEIKSRVDVLNGRQFGDAGAYERITGSVYFSLTVANPHNRGIVDLDNAVNLQSGEVEFSSDFVAIRPKDPNKSNGSMVLEIPNRGRGRIVALV